MRSGGLTPAPLVVTMRQRHRHSPAMSKLTEQDWQEAAATIGCEVAAIKAVAEVESPRGAFLPSGEPSLLFERHKFSRHTKGKFDATNPGVSNRKPGGYGSYNEQHARLQQAAELDRPAALKSASWGRFQILGENYQQAGFDSLQAFVNAMYASEQAQLKAFVHFILADPRLAKAIRHKDFDGFAGVYNGPNYKINDYAGKMQAAHAKWAA
jgi:hypothetical protein